MVKLNLVYKGRLPAMNEIIGANRRNFYMGNKLKQKTQQDIMAQFFTTKTRRRIPRESQYAYMVS